MKTAVSTAVLSSGGVAVAMNRLKRRLPSDRIPLTGLAAAFIFAAQMVNFPIAGGTSGHLIGGVLAAVLLGPSGAVIVMTAVLTVQCFLFADGGVAALGANLFNMAIVAPVSGYAVYHIVRRLFRNSRGELLAAGFASWCSTVLAAACAAGELAWAGTAPWNVVFPAMVHIHMLIGVGEAIITMLILSAVMAVRPSLAIKSRAAFAGELGPFLGYAFLVIIGLVLFVLPFASNWPDGLEHVAAALGFDRKAVATVSPPMQDYRFPLLGSTAAGTALAGLVGAGVVFVLAFLLSKTLVRRYPADSVSTKQAMDDAARFP